MIKQITQDILDVKTEMIYCDHCGEGVARQEDNNPDVKSFAYLHYECANKKNDSLGFLDNAEAIL